MNVTRLPNSCWSWTAMSVTGPHTLRDAQLRGREQQRDRLLAEHLVERHRSACSPAGPAWSATECSRGSSPACRWRCPAGGPRRRGSARTPPRRSRPDAPIRPCGVRVSDEDRVRPGVGQRDLGRVDRLDPARTGVLLAAVLRRDAHRVGGGEDRPDRLARRGLGDVQRRRRVDEPSGARGQGEGVAPLPGCERPGRGAEVRARLHQCARAASACARERRGTGSCADSRPPSAR